MLYDYYKGLRDRMVITLEDGREVEGWFFDGQRIDPDTLPDGSYWYQTRHDDNGDMSEPVTIVQDRVVVNFCGTFVCDTDLALEEETEIIYWSYVD